MATYLKIMPYFGFSKKDGSTTMMVPEGTLTFSILDNTFTFTLIKADGQKLTRWYTGQMPGTRSTYNSHDDPEFTGGYDPKIAEEDRKFKALWINDPEKLARGEVLTSLFDNASDDMRAIGSNSSLSVKKGEVMKYIPFPAELPDFAVSLTLINA